MRVFVQSFGCSTNLADGEVLMGCLAGAGYELVDSVSAADLVVYNTCAVKGPTENRAIDALKRIPSDKKLIVAGCLPLINFERLMKEVRFDGVVGPAAGEKVLEIAKTVKRGEKIVAIRGAINAQPSLNLPRVRLNPLVSIIPINYGCSGSCSYCCVVHARGNLRSYTVEEVVARVRNDFAAGVREFWITSQDTACYGRDRGANLGELLGAICEIDGDFKIRVGMMNPSVAKDILSDVIEAFRNSKIFKFAHLPVQSGDDHLLKRMRRFYSVDDFKAIIDAFRKEFPELTLSTDVICGFPGESIEAFESTVKLIEEVKPDVINVSKFFPRPRTAAANMRAELVPPAEVRRRSETVARKAKEIALEKNRRWIGWEGTILIDERGMLENSWVGRNFTYKPVTVRSLDSLLGKNFRVKVVNASSTHLDGEIGSD